MTCTRERRDWAAKPARASQRGTFTAIKIPKTVPQEEDQDCECAGTA